MDFLRKDKPSSLGWSQVLALLIFSYLFINTAWVAEDAYITFRSVDQLLAGNGPVWNLGERVQVYTHPLWYGLLVLTTGLGLPSYWGALLLSFICLLGVLALLFQLARRLERSVSKGNASEANGRHGTASSGRSASLLLGLLFLLSLSRSFVDYSSSGLENPLLHLLLLAYLAVYLSDQAPAKRFALTTFIYGLLFLTRPDGIILVTPTSIYLWLQMLKARQPWLKPALLALSPAIAWELFSLIYYGSLVPNTALAKVNLGYDSAQLQEQARQYFMVGFRFDPLTLATIGVALLAGFGVGLWQRRSLPPLLAAGLALQLAYIFRVGGDYMLGRFLSASLLLALVLLLSVLPQSLQPPAKRSPLWLLTGLLLLLSPNYRPSLNYGEQKMGGGFTDERGFYFQDQGLVPVLLKRQGHPLADERRRRGEEVVAAGDYLLSCVAGISIWALPLDRQVIDPLALTEPFLARLPARSDSRVGHYERALPSGFMVSRLGSANRLAAPELAQLYEDVQLATRSPTLLSRARLAALWRLNTGHYRDMGRYFDRDDISLREIGIDDNRLRALNAESQQPRLTVCINMIPIRTSP